MKPMFLWTKCAGVLLAACVLLVLPQYAATQTPTKQPAKTTPYMTPTGAQQLLKVLEQRIDMKDYYGASDLVLKEFLGITYSKLQARGLEFPVLVDTEAFKEQNPDVVDSIYDSKGQFAPFPKEMTVAAALRLALSKIPTRNATFVVMPDHILITTYVQTTPTAKLSEKVRGHFENRPISDVLRELSELAGATIVIDTRIGDKAKTPITATFVNDIPLAGALRIVTEMADLKVLVLDGAIFVTTPANASALRNDHAPKSKEKLGTTTLQYTGDAVPGFPMPPSYNPPPLDPFWPFDPHYGKV